MNNTLPILLAVFLFTYLQGQQLPYRSAFSQTGFIWNPGLTGTEDFLEFGTTYHRQWAEYELSPKTAGAYFQIPFVDLNMSMGASLQHEEIGLFQNSALQLAYAYHIPMGRRKRSRLSIGLAGKLSRFVFESSQGIASNPDDPLIFSENVDRQQSNFAVGLYYASNGSRFSRQNSWYAGLGMNQSIPKDLLLGEGETNFKRSVHANALVGARFYDDRGVLEPSLWLDYSAPNIIRMLTRVRYEWQDVYWATLGYSTDNTVHVAVGFVVQGGFLQDGQLRIGMLGSYAVGQIGRYQGLGYEFYLAYRFRLGN